MQKTKCLNAGWLLVLVAAPALALKSPTPGGATGADTETVQPQALEPKVENQAKPPPRHDVKTETPPAGKSPDSFTPTERIEADSAVSFPVDI